MGDEECAASDHVEMVDLVGVFVKRTTNAVLLILDEEEVWLPRASIYWSDVEIDRAAPGVEMMLEVPLWLAEDQGLA